MGTADTPPLGTPQLARPRAGFIVVLAVTLLVVAAFALPVVAWVVEAIPAAGDTWIVPLQIVLVLGIAAALAQVRARPEERRRRLGLGLATGALVLLVVDVVWWLLLAG